MADHALLTHFWAPIRPLLDRTDINDIFIDRFDYVYVSRGLAFEDTPCRWPDEQSFRHALAHLATTVNGVALTDRAPVLDARLPDGSRVAASLPPLSAHTQATIRVASKHSLDFAELEGRTFPADLGDFLRAAMAAYANIVVAGATASGKTTLMRALLRLSLDHDRFFVIEDTRELMLPFRRAVRHELTHGNAGGVKMADALRCALRNAPSRIIVGEIRDADAMSTYLEILEAGARGGLASLHASSAPDALERMEFLLMRRGSIRDITVAQQMVRRAINLIVFCELCPDNVRRVTQVAAMHCREPLVLWEYGPDGWTRDDAAIAKIG